MYWAVIQYVVPIGALLYAGVSMFPTRGATLVTALPVDQWGMFLTIPTGLVAVVANYGVSEYGRPWWLIVGVLALVVAAWIPVWILGGREADDGGNARANSGGKDERDA